MNIMNLVYHFLTPRWTNKQSETAYPDLLTHPIMSPWFHACEVVFQWREFRICCALEKQVTPATKVSRKVPMGTKNMFREKEATEIFYGFWKVRRPKPCPSLSMSGCSGREPPLQCGAISVPDSSRWVSLQFLAMFWRLNFLCLSIGMLGFHFAILK